MRNKKHSEAEIISAAIIRCFETPERTVNMVEAANIVDGIYYIGDQLNRIADVLEETKK